MSSSSVLYREIVLQDRWFYLVMNSAVVLLLILTCVFAFAGVPAGTAASAITTLFLLLLRQAAGKAVLLVTEDYFVMKFCFITFRTPREDIESVEIKDVNALPDPYRGHVAFWVRGIRFFNGLRVLRLRNGDAVHIRTRSGRTIIVTPRDNEELVHRLQPKEKEGR